MLINSINIIYTARAVTVDFNLGDWLELRSYTKLLLLAVINKY